MVDCGTVFTVGDITAPLCRGHRRAICVDGRYGQFYRCGESCQRYHQPDSKYFHKIIYIVSGSYSFFSVSAAVVCVSIQIEPYIPYEFTCEGMLQRVNILIEKQVG